MSTYPNYRKYPSSWGPLVAVLLILGGMTLFIIGSWRLSDGLNGIVIDYSNPFVHFSETTAAQEIIDGIIELFLVHSALLHSRYCFLLNVNSCFRRLGDDCRARINFLFSFSEQHHISMVANVFKSSFYKLSSIFNVASNGSAIFVVFFKRALF